MIHHKMESLNSFINDDPMAIVLMGFMSGLLFSGISWGIIYIILFLILWEILYFGYLNVNDRAWDFSHRLIVILATILGFLIGRFFHNDDDHEKSCQKFKEDMDYYGKEFGWFH